MVNTCFIVSICIDEREAKGQTIKGFLPIKGTYALVGGHGHIDELAHALS